MFNFLQLKNLLSKDAVELYCKLQLRSSALNKWLCVEIEVGAPDFSMSSGNMHYAHTKYMGEIYNT